MDLVQEDNDTDYQPQNTTAQECEAMRFHLSYLSDPFYKEPHIRTLITAMYSTVACMGALGNSMVIAAVLRNAQMRTPRNYFIINLALSDLLMCILTVPFTLYYVLNQFWDLGSTACKIVASAQGVNIFVSTMSITAIGLDRYWVILFPTRTQQQRFVILACFMVIWIFSLALAFPLFYATNTTLPFELEEPAAKCGIILFVCNENWEGMVIDRRSYSVCSAVFQYVLPLTMLTFAYTRIIWRLENRMVNRQRASAATHFERTASSSNTVTSNRRAVEQRQRRMNLLLICVVAFFAVCWFPLNVYNSLLSFDLAQYNVVAFVACHVFGMTSACANPILYGVFNENFRTEFIAILTFLKIVPVCRYFMKKLTPETIENRRTMGGAEPTMYTSTTVGGVDGGGGRQHEAVRLSCSAPTSNCSKRPGGTSSSRANGKNQKPRIARFKKFKDSTNNFLEFVTGDGAPESPPPAYPAATMSTTLIDNSTTKTVAIVTPTENGCCALTVFHPAKDEENAAKKKESMNGLVLENDTLNEAYQGQTNTIMSDTDFLSPVDADDKSTSAISSEAGADLISEEKIPLFSGKSAMGSGNLKTYMLNTHL